MSLSQEYLKECLDYDKNTGVFTWKYRPLSHFKSTRDCSAWNTMFAKKVAGTNHIDGYRVITIDNKRNLSHRIAWFYIYGEWIKEIDHKDNIRNHNWIKNLREATRCQNNQNQIKAQKHNKSTGLLGAYTNKRDGNFRSYIRINDKQKFLGYFETAQQAHDAYVSAKRELHPFGML